jgi:hypothetical protein
MDTSVTLIGLLIILLIGIPLTYTFRSNILNNAKIKEIKKQYSNNHYDFSQSEIKNRKSISIDIKKKGFLFIDYSYKEETVYFIDINKLLSCRLLPTKENSTDTILKIEFELVYKKTLKKELIPIYNIENDFLDFNCLHEDHQLGKKWNQLINDCLS